jgi:hypothetical protein
MSILIEEGENLIALFRRYYLPEAAKSRDGIQRLRVRVKSRTGYREEMWVWFEDDVFESFRQQLIDLRDLRRGDLTMRCLPSSPVCFELSIVPSEGDSYGVSGRLGVWTDASEGQAYDGVVFHFEIRHRAFDAMLERLRRATPLAGSLGSRLLPDQIPAKDIRGVGKAKGRKWWWPF